MAFNFAYFLKFFSRYLLPFSGWFSQVDDAFVIKTLPNKGS